MDEGVDKQFLEDRQRNFRRAGCVDSATGLDFAEIALDEGHGLLKDHRQRAGKIFAVIVGTCSNGGLRKGDCLDHKRRFDPIMGLVFSLYCISFQSYMQCADTAILGSKNIHFLLQISPMPMTEEARFRLRKTPSRDVVVRFLSLKKNGNPMGALVKGGLPLGFQKLISSGFGVPCAVQELVVLLGEKIRMTDVLTISSCQRRLEDAVGEVELAGSDGGIC